MNSLKKCQDDDLHKSCAGCCESCGPCPQWGGTCGGRAACLPSQEPMAFTLEASRMSCAESGVPAASAMSRLYTTLGPQQERQVQRPKQRWQSQLPANRARHRHRPSSRLARASLKLPSPRSSDPLHLVGEVDGDALETRRLTPALRWMQDLAGTSRLGEGEAALAAGDIV